MWRSKAARRRSPIRSSCWPTGAAARATCPRSRSQQIDEQLGLAVDRVMTEGSCYDRDAGGAGDQAGARRPGRGDLPAARLSHDPAALRRHPAARHQPHGRRAAHLLDLQGRAGRPGAGPDLRLHPPPARLRADGQRRAPGRADGAGRCGARPAAGRRHPRARRHARAAAARRRRRAGAGHHPHAAHPARRAAGAAAEPGARRRGLPAGARPIRPSAATATTIPSSARSASARCRCRSCRRSWASRSRSPRSTSPNATWSTSSPARTTCRRNSPAATAWPSAMPSARRWPWRWSTARCAPRSCRRTSPRRRRTRSSCCRIPTASRPRASCSISSCRTTSTSSPSWSSCALLRAEVEARQRQAALDQAAE